MPGLKDESIYGKVKKAKKTDKEDIDELFDEKKNKEEVDKLKADVSSAAKKKVAKKKGIIETLTGLFKRNN